MYKWNVLITAQLVQPQLVQCWWHHVTLKQPKLEHQHIFYFPLSAYLFYSCASEVKEADRWERLFGRRGGRGARLIYQCMFCSTGYVQLVKIPETLLIVQEFLQTAWRASTSRTLGHTMVWWLCLHHRVNKQLNLITSPTDIHIPLYLREDNNWVFISTWHPNVHNELLNIMFMYAYICM